MTLRDICTSLELSKKLAEAGVSQEGGIAYWHKIMQEDKKDEWMIDKYDKRPIALFGMSGTLYKEPIYRAFCFNELWECLPNCIENEDEIYYKRFLPPAIMIYVKGAEPRWLKKYEGDAPQEAAGEFLLWCIEQGYVSSKEE